MEDALREIVDYHLIRRVLADYCNACDRQDEVRMAATYSAQSWDDHGHRSGTGADFSKMITQEMANHDSLSHLLGQSTIDVSGDAAGAETYFIAVIRAPDETGRDMLHQLGGRYVDRLVRENGAWRIQNRRAVRDWSITLSIDADWIAHQGLAAGRRDNDDPAFDVLDAVHSGVPGPRSPPSGTGGSDYG